MWDGGRTVKITFPQGWNLDKMDEILRKKGYGKKSPYTSYIVELVRKELSQEEINMICEDEHAD